MIKAGLMEGEIRESNNSIAGEVLEGGIIEIGIIVE
jgi:hypothetical protein